MKKAFFLLVSILSASSSCVLAMNRFEALSQIESHDNDRAIGRHQEVSRYQIMPSFWEAAQAHFRGVTDPSPTNPKAATAVAGWIMQARCRTFAERYHRDPSDFEYYILWHRPACLIGRAGARHLTRMERERGLRYANLCQGGD